MLYRLYAPRDIEKSLRDSIHRRTLRFLADGPPSGGTVQCSPQFGFAVTTAFAGTTMGWSDEDVR